VAGEDGYPVTITHVGNGTTATAVNAPVTPVAHASTAVGDMVIVFTSTRNEAGSFSSPVGWRAFIGGSNIGAFGRIWESGDVIPAFTPVGTGAGDDVFAMTLTLRGAEPLVPDAFLAGVGPLSQSNASAQDIAIPALDVPYDDLFCGYIVWKQDDCTVIAGIAAWSGVTTASSTAGNDASMGVKYIVQTTATDISAQTLAVTGGAAAISKAVNFTVRPAASLSVVAQDTWPTRVLISLTGLTLDDTVELYRSVDGVRTAVRAGSSAGVTDSSFLKIDSELPFGVPVSYIAVINDGVEYQSADVVYTLAGGKVALTDSVTGLSAEVVIQAWPVKRIERRSTTFAVGGRSVVVSGGFGGFSGEITVFTETTTSAEQVEALLRSATSGTIQIRNGPGHDDIDSYVVVTSIEKTRYDEGDGADERRLWVLDAVEVESWAPALESAGYSYADLDTAYTDLTYADLDGDYATYLALAQAELG
jgi:hypothetical protein